MNKLVIVEPDELKTILRDTVREIIVEAVDKPAFINTAEVAKLLGCTPASVSTYVSRDGLPVAGRSGKIRQFNRDEVIEWAKGRGSRRKPIDLRRVK